MPEMAERGVVACGEAQQRVKRILFKRFKSQVSGF
jgi:hypothetical protein